MAKSASKVILLKCGCGNLIRVSRSHIGKRLKCPDCGAAIAVRESHENHSPTDSAIPKIKRRSGLVAVGIWTAVGITTLVVVLAVMNTRLESHARFVAEANARVASAVEDADQWSLSGKVDGFTEIIDRLNQVALEPDATNRADATAALNRCLKRFDDLNTDAVEIVERDTTEFVPESTDADSEVKPKDSLEAMIDESKATPKVTTPVTNQGPIPPSPISPTKPMLHTENDAHRHVLSPGASKTRRIPYLTVDSEGKPVDLMNASDLGIYVADLSGSDRLNTRGGVQPPVSDGVVLLSVDPNGPARRTVFKPGDILSEIGDDKITSATDFYSKIRSLKEGAKVRISGYSFEKDAYKPAATVFTPTSLIQLRLSRLSEPETINGITVYHHDRWRQEEWSGVTLDIVESPLREYSLRLRIQIVGREWPMATQYTFASYNGYLISLSNPNPLDVTRDTIQSGKLKRELYSVAITPEHDSLLGILGDPSRIASHADGAQLRLPNDGNGLRCGVPHQLIREMLDAFEVLTLSARDHN